MGRSNFSALMEITSSVPKLPRFYLSSGGADAETHRMSRELQGEGKNSWCAIPYGAIVPPRMDEVANPILTFEAAIDQDVEFTGPLTLSLSFSCTEIDSHVIARVGRVDARGNYQSLSLGSLRPACRRIDTERSTSSEIAINIDTPEPLVPGQPVELRFSLTPRPALFKRGDRVRLDIASRTDLLRSDVAHGCEQFDMQVPPYFSRNTVHFGETSYLELEQVARD
jgi:predicted acyl esterase